MKTFIFTIALEQDEEGWRAFYAPLEHLGASTWGESKAEALQNIKEVLSMILEEFQSVFLCGPICSHYVNNS